MTLADERAEALLEAHVKHTLDALQGPAAEQELQALVDEALAVARGLTLATPGVREAVKRLARRHVVEQPLGAAHRRVVQAVGRAVHEHPLLADTRLDAVLGTVHFRELLRLVLRQRSAREVVVREFVASPLYGRLASELLMAGIRGYLQQNVVTDNIPGARSMMKLGMAVLSKATPKLESTVETGLKTYVARNVGGVSQRSVELLLGDEGDRLLAETAEDAWRELGALSLAELGRHLGADDRQALLDAALEHWNDLRQSEMLGAWLDAGIDAVFDAHPGHDLASLLADFGFERSCLVEDAATVLAALPAPVLRELVEPVLRARLAAFYRSSACRAVLDGAG